MTSASSSTTSGSVVPSSKKALATVSISRISVVGARVQRIEPVDPAGHEVAGRIGDGQGVQQYRALARQSGHRRVAGDRDVRGRVGRQRLPAQRVDVGHPVVVGPRRERAAQLRGQRHALDRRDVQTRRRASCRRPRTSCRARSAGPPARTGRRSRCDTAAARRSPSPAAGSWPKRIERRPAATSAERQREGRQAPRGRALVAEAVDVGQLVAVPRVGSRRSPARRRPSSLLLTAVRVTRLTGGAVDAFQSARPAATRRPGFRPARARCRVSSQRPGDVQLLGRAAGLGGDPHEQAVDRVVDQRVAVHLRTDPVVVRSERDPLVPRGVEVRLLEAVRAGRHARRRHCAGSCCRLPSAACRRCGSD